jgi:GNAT superfamily N-acetyltransferase
MAKATLDLKELDGPRPLRREEWAAAQRLERVCFSGVLGETDDADWEASYIPPKRGGWQVIAYQGEPISLIGTFHSKVSVYGSPLRIGSIGGVCTHPNTQGQGLATRLLEHCTRRLAEEGARLILISGMRGLYTHAGNVTAQDFEYVALKPGQLQPGAGDLSIRPATAADAALCARIYQAEPVHFVRRVTRFAEHFDRREEFLKGDDWIVELGGLPVAYCFTRLPWGHTREQGVREVVEYAGSRVALAGSLAQAMAGLNLRELRLAVPWQDTDFSRLLREQGVAGNRIPMPEHTMRIINFPGLMADLRPYMQARLPENLRPGLRFEQQGLALSEVEGDRYAIVSGRERLELDGAAMTQRVMGLPQEMAGEAASQAAGRLDEIISTLFPLPSFLPGLNYR